jgi:hypothetical protein
VIWLPGQKPGKASIPLFSSAVAAQASVERAFDAADLAQRQRQTVLPGVAAQALEHQ